MWFTVYVEYQCQGVALLNLLLRNISNITTMKYRFTADVFSHLFQVSALKLIVLLVGFFFSSFQTFFYCCGL